MAAERAKELAEAAEDARQREAARQDDSPQAQAECAAMFTRLLGEAWNALWAGPAFPLGVWQAGAGGFLLASDDVVQITGAAIALPALQEIQVAVTHLGHLVETVPIRLGSGKFGYTRFVYADGHVTATDHQPLKIIHAKAMDEFKGRMGGYVSEVRRVFHPCGVLRHRTTPFPGLWIHDGQLVLIHSTSQLSPLSVRELMLDSLSKR